MQHAGEFGPNRGDAGVRGGGVHGAGHGVPAFGAVVPEHDEVLQSGDAREASVAHRDARRAAGDHGDGGDLRRERRERGHRAGVGAGLLGVRDDVGERAVEVEGDDRAVGPGENGVEPLAVEAGVVRFGRCAEWLPMGRAYALNGLITSLVDASSAAHERR